jgi:hypothetical protein
MTSLSSGRTVSTRNCVLIMRAWIEPDHPTPLRARITWSIENETQETSHQEQSTIPKTETLAVTVEDALGVVRSCLERCLSQER